MWERTKTLLPGARGEVWTEGAEGDGQVDHAADGGSVVRIEGHHPEAGEVRAFLRVGAGKWVEAVCPNARRRVRRGPESESTSRSTATCGSATGAGGCEARGVEDESAGYHPHHTVWSWSAGVGRTSDGRARGLEPGQRHQRSRGALRARHLARRRAVRARAGRLRGPRRDRASTTARDSSSRPSASGAGRRTGSSLATHTGSRSARFSGTLPGGLELERASASWSTTTPIGERRQVAFARQLACS